MPPHRSLTRYPQASSASDRWSSPSVELQASSSRTPATPAALTSPPPENSLFANLLFNREQVYNYRSAPVPERRPDDAQNSTIRRTHASPVEPQIALAITNSGNTARSAKESMPPSNIKIEKPATKVSRGRGRPRKKDVAKSKGKLEELSSRKRAGANGGNREDRPAKRSRPTAALPNTSKRIDDGGSIDSTSGSGTLTLGQALLHQVIDLTVDDETENEPEKDKPSKMLQALHRSPYGLPVTAPQDATWQFAKQDSPYSETDLKPSPLNENVATDNLQDVAMKMQNVRSELLASQEEVKRLQEEKRKGDIDLEQEKSKTEKSKQDMAKLTRDLEAERHAARAVTQERDQLRKQLQETDRIRNQLQQTVVADKAKYAKFESDHQILQTRYESELKSRKEEQKSHSEILASILESKQAETSKPDPQLHALKTENARLTLENTNLKAAASTYRSQPTLSPVPSSASSNSDVKDDNVRKMYIKVKRQYETLQSAATKLVTCTRSMDLTSFGEFGTYIKRLRGALDGNRDGEDGGSQGSSTAMVVRKDEDDDDTWGSQRSG